MLVPNIHPKGNKTVAICYLTTKKWVKFIFCSLGIVQGFFKVDRP